MKKIYMILAAMTLLSMSLNAQTTYEKVTSASQIAAGNKYIVVDETQSLALGSLKSTTAAAYANVVSVTINNNTIDVTGLDVMPLTLAVVGTKSIWSSEVSANVTVTTYSLQMPDDGFLGWNGSGTTFKRNATATDNYFWFYGPDHMSSKVNNFYLAEAPTRIIGTGSDNSGNPRFGAYVASNAVLYVQSGGTTPVTNPALTVSTTSLSIADGATTATFTVSGTNLTDAVAVSATNGFTVNPATISAADAMAGNVTVTVTAPSGATSQTTGTITVTSGTATQTVNVTYTPSGGSTPSGNELTVPEDATTYTGVLPVYGLWYDSSQGQHNQMIYPSTMLTDMVGKTITSLTFYTRGNLAFYDGNVQLSLGTTSSTTFSSTSPTALTDNVTVSGSVVPAASTGDTELTIQLTTPYVYNGGNLLVDIVTQTGEYGSTNFYAKDMGENVGFY